MKPELERRGIVNEIHAPSRRKYLTKPIVLKGINDLWQADLVDMIPHAKENRQYKYILTVINCFTKEAYARPLKSKTGEDVAEAFHEILKSTSPPHNLHVDKGKEFYNRTFQKLMRMWGVNMYSTNSINKAAMVERFNRTLKTNMFKEFHMQGNYKWVDMLQSLITRYNNTIHRTIKMKPSQVKDNHQNALRLLNTVYMRKNPDKLPKFRVNDIVRISKIKGKFQKGYLANWSTELFKIKKVLNTVPRTYMLYDLNEEPITGSFYEEEIRKTKFPDTYLVEKILKRKGNKVLIKWLGFDKPSWQLAKHIL